MAVIGYSFHSDWEIVIPRDVVQWRVVAEVEDLVLIHLARGDGRFEVRYLEEGAECYVLGELRYMEGEGSDEASVFIEEEW